MALGRGEDALSDYTAYIDKFQRHHANQMAATMQGMGPSLNDLLVDALMKRTVVFQQLGKYLNSCMTMC